jgi:general secretion pathway protein A
MYLSFYGLEEQPFNVTPDPGFLLLSKNHQDALTNLLYGIRCRKGFMELTGAIGCGKTTLCRALLSNLGEVAKSALIINPSLSPGQLLQTIVEDFEVDVQKRNRKGYFDALNEFLLELASHESTAVLIIDEAQNLKPGTLEQIRLISNFESNKEKLLQIVLVGQPELRDLLEQPSLAQIRQRITVSAHLSPLSREETEQYIAHRIRVAGGKDMLIFDSATIDGVYQYSQGVPRVINILCDKALLMAFIGKTGWSMMNFVGQPRK